MIHTIKGFSVVNEAEIDIFLEFPCFFLDPLDVGNLISGSSPFSKCSLYIWNFSVHIPLKPSLKDFEHYLASMWNEHNYADIFIHMHESSMYMLLLSHFSRVRLCATPRLPRPWDSPGKNTGVGCHFLLQCMKVKSESQVAQSYLTLSDPMDCSLPSFSVHRIFQAKVLEWGAIALSMYICNINFLYIETYMFERQKTFVFYPFLEINTQCE